MQPRDFVYWLNGFAELQETAPSAEQWQMIVEHLNLVLNKVTPELAPKQKPTQFDWEKIFKDFDPNKFQPTPWTDKVKVDYPIYPGTERLCNPLHNPSFTDLSKLAITC